MRSKNKLYKIISIVLLIVGGVIYFNNYEKFYISSIDDIKIEEKKIKEKLNDKVIENIEIKKEINSTKELHDDIITNEVEENNIVKEVIEEVKVDKNNDKIIEENISVSNEKIIEKIVPNEEINKVEESKTPIEVVKSVEEKIKKVKTQEEINDEFRKSIENEYGVTIKYGNEMGDYRLSGYLPTKLTDPLEINENLDNIKKYIAYYPVGFFKEMKDFGMPLTIYLVKNIPNSGIAGIADKEFYDDIKITVCTDEFFFRVFHHEIYHYIEAYMEVVGYDNGVFTNWDSFNPDEFIYGSTNSSYSYSLINPPINSYFINDYGQTNDREDRATIFEDLISRAYETNNSFISTNNIWLKGKAICEEIDKYFDTVNLDNIERWERFIYN